MKIKQYFVITAIAALSTVALANHQWSTYHWATSTGAVNLEVIDSVTSDWQITFEDSIGRWNQSNNINQTVVAGSESRKDRKRCTVVTGKMKVCNASYGFNGWAGLASINLDSNGHITQGTAKMNDSYLAGDTTAERNHVMCQEMGHVYGLNHTSTDGTSQQTCMDYSTSVNSQWPNAHDYEQLAAMYAHTDGYDTATIGGTGGGSCKGGPKKCGSRANPSFGIKVMQQGRMQMWVAPGENGTMWVHHVYLAEGATDITHD